MIGAELCKRLLTMAIVLLGVSLLTYGLVFVTPGDPARTILTQQMGGQAPSQDAVDQFRAENGLDDPFIVQYAAGWGTHCKATSVNRTTATGLSLI